MWSMPLMPYMSPAAIGFSVVRLRGASSRSKRAPMAASTLSGQPRPLDELMMTTSPSRINAAAWAAVMTFFMLSSGPRGVDSGRDAGTAGLDHRERGGQGAHTVLGRGGRRAL